MHLENMIKLVGRFGRRGHFYEWELFWARQDSPANCPDAVPASFYAACVASVMIVLFLLGIPLIAIMPPSFTFNASSTTNQHPVCLLYCSCIRGRRL